MKFGLTDAQRWERNQAALKQQYERVEQWFAWWPVSLQDGRTAWLEWVWRTRWNIHMHYGQYYADSDQDKWRYHALEAK